MRTVQMTLQDDLVKRVDRVARKLGTTRSAFTRRALREALERLRITSLEEKQRTGYERKPVGPGEFDRWESEQAWGD
jgi:metal-responsive CopG/Arc/MetJ family transcriptional regulator